MPKQLTSTVPVTDVKVVFTGLLGETTPLLLTFPGHMSQRQIEGVLKIPQFYGCGHEYHDHEWRDAAIDPYPDPKWRG
jgi:hypothetical protein